MIARCGEYIAVASSRKELIIMAADQHRTQEKPIAAFVLALLGGLWMLVAGVGMYGGMGARHARLARPWRALVRRLDA